MHWTFVELLILNPDFRLRKTIAQAAIEMRSQQPVVFVYILSIFVYLYLHVCI